MKDFTDKGVAVNEEELRRKMDKLIKNAKA